MISALPANKSVLGMAVPGKQSPQTPVIRPVLSGQKAWTELNLPPVGDVAREIKKSATPGGFSVSKKTKPRKMRTSMLTRASAGTGVARCARFAANQPITKDRRHTTELPAAAAEGVNFS